MLNLSDIKFDCRFFKGDKPCFANKQFDATCVNCIYYEKTSVKILIIKLGAAGDVIRSTPILYPLKEKYPDSKIFWLTYSPELVPSKKSPCVDETLYYNFQNVLYLQNISFDIAINLDKDRESISVMKSVESKIKYGYTQKNDYCYPVSKSSEHKFLTGIFDDYSKENKKSYPEEIFEICGFKYNKQPYILEFDARYKKELNLDYNKKIIGINTGCGERWTSRIWKDEYFIDLISKLAENGFEVLLLGGQLEHEKNKLFSENTPAKYFGHYDLKTFINIVNECSLVITQVTMTLHIALGLGKKVVLLNNIFNPCEFELFGNGIIVQPSKECKCYFNPVCVNTGYNCMDYLLPDDVYSAVVKLLL